MSWATSGAGQGLAGQTGPTGKTSAGPIATVFVALKRLALHLRGWGTEAQGSPRGDQVNGIGIGLR